MRVARKVQKRFMCLESANLQRQLWICKAGQLHFRCLALDPVPLPPRKILGRLSSRRFRYRISASRRAAKFFYTAIPSASDARTSAKPPHGLELCNFIVNVLSNGRKEATVGTSETEHPVCRDRQEPRVMANAKVFEDLKAALAAAKPNQLNSHSTLKAAEALLMCLK